MLGQVAMILCQIEESVTTALRIPAYAEISVNNVGLMFTVRMFGDKQMRYRRIIEYTQIQHANFPEQVFVEDFIQEAIAGFKKALGMP